MKNAWDRNVKSPTKMREYRERMISPINFRKRKNTSAPLPLSILSPRPSNILDENTTEWTEEQTIINEKAKMRVLEARMSRFTGFKSPHILFKKLIDRMSICVQKNFDSINSIEVTDEVYKNENWENSSSFRYQNNDLTILSL